MGFLSRSVSLIRYRVRGEMEGSFRDAIDEGIKKGAFREVEGSGDIVGLGWTSIEDFTDTGFTGASYSYGEYVAFSLRVDTAKVPARILEIHFKNECRKLLERSEQKRLSFGQRRDLKERLQETLRKQVLPAIQIFDLVWNTSAGVVYFCSHGLKARERMEDHFKKCFGLTLLPILPYTRAEEILGTAELKKRLEDLRPSVMAP